MNSVMKTCSHKSVPVPVNDILDIVMHALVVSSSVGLDVKCNLGKYAEFHHITTFK